MHIETFFDEQTSTFTHIVVDESEKKSAIIDSVLDYDQFSGRVCTTSADKVIEYIQSHNLTNEWILETHIHADHITAAQYLKEKVGGKTGAGIGLKKVLETWVSRFNNENDTDISGNQFDILFKEGDFFNIGSIKVKVWQTPGHTPACLAYLIKDSIFVGDTIFAPRMGTARCDFPGGDAKELYKSIKRYFDLPEKTKMYLCHDYPEGNQKPIAMVSVGEQKRDNIALNGNTTLEEFVEKRQKRDKSLAVPKLLYPSIQTNMRLGGFGAKAKNAMQYIKIPVSYK